MAQQSYEMATAFRPPDPKKTLSARVRRSSHEKVAVLVKLWRARLEAEGKGEQAKEIDPTFVVDALLAKAADDELAEWGGWPDTPAKVEAALKKIRAATDKH
jgi:hypothetical protein